MNYELSVLSYLVWFDRGA